MAISSLDGFGALPSERAEQPLRRAPVEEDHGLPIVSEPDHDSAVDRRPDVVRPAETSSDAGSRDPSREYALGYSPRSPAEAALDVARSDVAIERLREAQAAFVTRRSLISPE